MDTIKYKNGKILIHLKELLNDRGISQTRFLKLTDMQQKSYKRWIASEIRSIDLDVLCRICNVLNCSVSDVIEYIPDKD